MCCGRECAGFGVWAINVPKFGHSQIGGRWDRRAPKVWNFYGSLHVATGRMVLLTKERLPGAASFKVTPSLSWDSH
jgi:hypothetical protein